MCKKREEARAFLFFLGRGGGEGGGRKFIPEGKGGEGKKQRRRRVGERVLHNWVDKLTNSQGPT